MKIKQGVFGIIFLTTLALVQPCHASLLVCQNKLCDYVHEGLKLKPWIRKLHTFFKNPNARIDFCTADPQKRTCTADKLTWTAASEMMNVVFTLPVARTIPQKNTLLMDYLITANESLPSCNFSVSTFEESDAQNIRFVSNPFSCELTGLGRTQFQNTFFIDLIDFDNAVVGAQYVIQTHGELKGQGAGYALMKFRDGNTLLPLVPQPYQGEMPAAPDAQDARRIQKQLTPKEPPKDKFDAFVDGVKDWWEQLKESFNLDKKKSSTSSNVEPTWWDNFSENFMKVIYLEPLD